MEYQCVSSRYLAGLSGLFVLFCVATEYFCVGVHVGFFSVLPLKLEKN